MMSVFEKNNKIIYVTLLGLICMVLAMRYIPALKPYTGFVTPPVVLFTGLVYDLL